MDALYSSLRQLELVLERSGISWAVIGGLAVAVWGEPRLTRDVDVKLALRREDAEGLIELLGPGYSPTYGDPLHTARSMGILFFQDGKGTKIDLLLADLPFDESAIARARSVTIGNQIAARLCTPEDLIVYKLLSSRPRDLEDARSVVKRQHSRLDREYVEKWLRDFEEMLDDSTLVQTFLSL